MKLDACFHVTPKALGRTLWGLKQRVKIKFIGGGLWERLPRPDGA